MGGVVTMFWRIRAYFGNLIRTLVPTLTPEQSEPEATEIWLQRLRAESRADRYAEESLERTLEVADELWLVLTKRKEQVKTNRRVA